MRSRIIDIIASLLPIVSNSTTYPYRRMGPVRAA